MKLIIAVLIATTLAGTASAYTLYGGKLQVHNVPDNRTVVVDDRPDPRTVVVAPVSDTLANDPRY